VAAGRRVITVVCHATATTPPPAPARSTASNGAVIACSTKTAAQAEMPMAAIGRDDAVDHDVPSTTFRRY
jgi:hypothetical protein